jgi:hypothetical protein
VRGVRFTPTFKFNTKTRSNSERIALYFNSYSTNIGKHKADSGQEMLTKA